MRSKHETKILATLGPSSLEPDIMKELVLAGADGFRFNMSHFTSDQLSDAVRKARLASAEAGKHIAIAADLGGPKIRVTGLGDRTITLREGDEPVLGCDIPITHPEILSSIKDDERILLDDGKIELVALRGGARGVRTRVVTGGILLHGKGVNLPETDLRLPALTDKDISDIATIVHADADYMSLSFVQSPDDMLAARREAEAVGRCPWLIAKIEKPMAVERFSEILAVSDGIMIARGDLGVELPPERVPVLQKKFISRVNSEGKIVITATQMLESMTSNPRPTRAEASDVANAVWDGTDAVMLSGETAVGRYPVETVKMMRSIIIEAENAAPPRREPFYDTTPVHALASAAVGAAEDLNAAAIVAVTVSGFTAQMLAQRRPNMRMIAIVPDEHVRNCLQLLWGAIPIVVPWRDTSDAFLDELEEALVAGGHAAEGDTVVLVSGSTKLRGTDYMMKIHHVKRPSS